MQAKFCLGVSGGLVLSAVLAQFHPAAWVLAGLELALGLIGVYDLTQRRHAILRNFPVIGHFR